MLDIYSSLSANVGASSLAASFDRCLMLDTYFSLLANVVTSLGAVSLASFFFKRAVVLLSSAVTVYLAIPVFLVPV